MIYETKTMSLNYVQNECQPSGHRLSVTTIGRLWHTMTRQRLRVRFTSVVQLLSKTLTPNRWKILHKQTVCVITERSVGQELSFARFYDQNLKTIYLSFILNHEFMLETRSEVFFVFNGSDGQSIGIKFGDKSEAKDFDIIITEKRLKLLEQLYPNIPKPNQPIDICLSSVAESGETTDTSVIAGNNEVTDDHSDPLYDTEEEDSEDTNTEDNDNQSDGGTDDYDKEYDVILETKDISVIAGNYKSISGSDSGQDNELFQEVEDFLEELATDDNGDEYEDTHNGNNVDGIEVILSDGSSDGCNDDTVCDGKAQHNVIYVDSETYEQMRETMSAGNRRVFIKKDSKRSKSPKKSGPKFCCFQ